MQRLSTPGRPGTQNFSLPRPFQPANRSAVLEPASEAIPAIDSPGQSLEERIEQLESQNNFLLRVFQYFKELLPDLHDKLFPDQQADAPNNDPAKSGGRNRQKTLITRRELEVLRLIAEGLSAKEIAQRLYISETTVITHKKNLKEKFNVRNTAELVRKTSLFLGA